MAKPIIHTIKHYSHRPATGIPSGSLLSDVLVNAVAKGAARSNTFDIEEGALVKAVFLERWITSATALQTANWALLKRPAAVAGPTVAQMSNLGSYPNKKNILMSGQGIPPSSGNVMAIAKNWFLIPKGKQRFGLGDSLVFVINSVGATITVCGLSTFKENE